jgi:hypothetical protein
MENLQETITEQENFVVQVAICLLLMQIYKDRPEKFKEIISPRFEKAYPLKTPYANSELFWEYCDWLSSIITGHYAYGKYPILKKTRKNIWYIDYVTNKRKAHSFKDKIIPFLEMVENEI